MGFKVVVAKTAERELSSALERLAIDFESPSTARRLGNEFRCLFPVLERFPYGKPVDFAASERLRVEVSRTQVWKYLAYYVVDAMAGTVNIISPLSMKQDQLVHLIRDYRKLV